MALLQTSFIWIAYAVAVAILLLVAVTFLFLFKDTRERSIATSVVCILTISSLLATVLLLPVDVALVSATNKPSEGRRKDWATPDQVDSIVYFLRVVYYILYSVDTVLCCVVVPFTYFWYEEHDDVASEEGRESLSTRIWNASKYTIVFILLLLILLITGFFIPVATRTKREDLDLDYFKHLLAETHGERALTFCVGLLMVIGIVLYVLYTAVGMALLPVALIKSAPAISIPALANDTANELQRNRDRQRQLELREETRSNGLDARQRREFESLRREERTLVRRQRFAEDSEGHHWVTKTWNKLEAFFRPIKLIGGLLLAVIGLIIWSSMLITGIDKAKNSACKANCGYIQGLGNIFQPVNELFLASAKYFPVDYIIYLLLLLFLFSSTVCGIAAVGIRFLWLRIFRIRRGHTSPQALLLATVMLALSILALNYSLTVMIAPQYSIYGPQKYCDRLPRHPGEQPDCSEHQSAIKPCSVASENPVIKDVCTPSVMSTFINRIIINYPYFGIFDFWAQFGFLGIYLAVFVTALIRSPRLHASESDADLQEEEEEGLLASTGRRFNATWQDLTSRVKNVPNYGTTDDNANRTSSDDRRS